MPDNHGQFVLMQAPAALPGKCVGCGRATDPLGFIDTGHDSPDWGVIYYCSECIKDMASKFGYIGPEVAEQLNNRIGELEVETASQRAAILGLEDTVDGLLRVRDSGASSITVPIQPDTPAEPESQEPASEENTINFPDPISEGPDFPIAVGESEINNPVSEQGSDGIPNDNGLADWAELSL